MNDNCDDIYSPFKAQLLAIYYTLNKWRRATTRPDNMFNFRSNTSPRFNYGKFVLIYLLAELA